jgi:hypothetical protein
MGKVANFFSSQRIPVDGQKRVKMLHLDAKFEEMETEIQVLKAENLKLKSQVKPLERDVKRLKERITEMEVEASQASDEALDEKAHALLAAIANKDGRSPARVIGGTAAQAEFYRGELRKRGLVRHVFSYTNGGWAATQDGLKYLRKLGRL